MRRRLNSFIIFFEIFFNKFKNGFSKNNGAKNNILIIKVDAIGDYILFRNCLSVIKNSVKYKDSKITLLGNCLWKDIATTFDIDTVTSFLWINHKKYKNFHYKRSFLSDLSTRKFSEVMVFHYSRNLLTEILAFAANAPVKTAMIDDFSLLGYNTRKYTDRLYTRLIRVGTEHDHEFKKNMRFAELLCDYSAGTSSGKMQPDLNIENIQPVNGENGFEKKYILINSGAGDLKRMYPYNKLLFVTEQLFNEGYHLCFTGTAQDMDFVNTVKQHNPAFLDRITDLTGKTNLVQLLQIINGAFLVICNETSVYHMSIALKKPVICFTGGGHFSRFANYGSSKTVKLVYNQMSCFNCNWKCIYSVKDGESFPCIQSLPNTDILEMLRNITG